MCVFFCLHHISYIIIRLHVILPSSYPLVRPKTSPIFAPTSPFTAFASSRRFSSPSSSMSSMYFSNPPSLLSRIPSALCAVETPKHTCKEMDDGSDSWVVIKYLVYRLMCAHLDRQKRSFLHGQALCRTKRVGHLEQCSDTGV